MDELQKACRELLREYQARIQQISTPDELDRLDAEMAQRLLEIVCRYIE